MAPLFQITALLFLLSAGFLPLHVPPAPQPKTERFIGSFDLIANQDYPNGTTRSDTVSYFFGMHETAILIHAGKNQPDMRMVINPTDSTITGLFEMQGKKGGYVLPMNDRYWPGMRHALEATSNTVQPGKDPLGDSKMIEGYRCRKVFAESSDYTAEL